MPTAAMSPTPRSATSPFSRRVLPMKPWNTGAFVAKELLDHTLLVKHTLSLDHATPRSPLIRAINSRLQRNSLPLIIPPTVTRPLAAAILDIHRSSLTPAHENLIEELLFPLGVIARFKSRRTGALRLPPGPKLMPRSQLMLWSTTLGLIGLHIGMPNLYLVTVTLRPGEDADTARTSLREKLEETCLVPFLHTEVFVAGNAVVPSHIHFLILARDDKREWRGLSAYACERNKRSGIATSVNITEVKDLPGLIRHRARWDPAAGRITGNTGYLAGNGNLTLPGSKPRASQLVRSSANDLLQAGSGTVREILNHLLWLTRPPFRSTWRYPSLAVAPASP